MSYETAPNWRRLTRTSTPASKERPQRGCAEALISPRLIFVAPTMKGHRVVHLE